jgi:transcriptional regulator GlxA family with amidase domain
MARDHRLFAFTVYPGVTPLDLIGPMTVLRDLRFGSPYRTVTVGSRRELTSTDTPLGLVPAATLADVPAPFALFVPGGGEATRTATQDKVLVAYVRTAAETASVVGSTGNGALILAAAGLLEGRRVAVHWAYADPLRRLGAHVTTDRWTRDGKFVTAAGGTAGVDAMLQLAADLTKPARARLAQLAMEYDPQPPFGRPDMSLAEQVRPVLVSPAARTIGGTSIGSA